MQAESPQIKSVLLDANCETLTDEGSQEASNDGRTNSSISEEKSNTCLLWGVKEVCSALGLGRTAIYNLLNTGRLPLPIKLGGKVCWKKDEIIRWIAADCPPRKQWLAMRVQR